MEQKDKTIFAVDDEASILDVYSIALGGSFNVECFLRSEDMLARLKNVVPDLIILDIMMDAPDGYETLAILRSNANYADIPVIMVSAKSTEVDKAKGLNLGADDYLAKPFGIMELTARINAKFRRESPKNKYTYKDIVIDDNRHEVSINGQNVVLTLKQYTLLKLLVKNAETVLNRDFLLDSVWGENYGETRTLDIHISDLRKLLKDSQTDIRTVRGVGYSLT